MALLEIKNLDCRYGDIHAVNDVSFTLEKNEKLCILGANGSGKTTLLSAVADLIPYSGEIIINGKNSKNMKSRERAANIAMLRQTSQIYFSYTVRDTVAMGRYAKNKGIFSPLSKEDNEKIDECMREMGIYDIKEREISTLSGGQLQRVYLARAFAQEPKIILFDEPTNHLDLFYKTELCEKAEKWVKNGDRAIIAVFHDIGLAVSFADKIILVKDGKIVKAGNADIVRDDKLLYEVYGASVREYFKKSLKFFE